MNSEPESAEGLASSEEPRNGVSRGALVLAVLVAVVISGVAGLAIGWKVEHSSGITNELIERLKK